MTFLLGTVLPVHTTWAHDAPNITPTRLDFDASQAPKNCNDKVIFRKLLVNWVRSDVLAPEADRRLVVRIRRSPTGGQLVDVTLFDAADVVLGEYHERYTTECHKVLYDAARAAARLLGAFKEPPPPEPCPTLPPPPPPQEPTPCPACSAPTAQSPRIVIPLPPMRRLSLGAGVLFGTGDWPAHFLGPQISLAFVPSIRLRHMRIELDGAWAPYTLTKSNPLRGDMIPLFGSLCYAPSALRLCSGLVTTFFLGVRETDAMHMTLAASLRLGTEFKIADPLSIRLDAFTLVRFGGRTFGPKLAAPDALNPFTAGASVMGVWSFE